ncbi:hypothetical protein BG004_004968 [Podila humilis]|nr:hypothetical protein BG004_004968 [Podila humilis]
MVRLCLSLLATALVAVASAAPFEQLPFKSHSVDDCAAAIGETQAFVLESVSTGSLVSSKDGGPLLFSGEDGSKSFEPLRFCVVTNGESKCGDQGRTSCIKRRFPYQIRVEGHLKGYVMQNEDHFIVIPDYEAATPLFIDGNGHLDIQVLGGFFRPAFAWTVTEAGQPIQLQLQAPGIPTQLFRALPILRDIHHENSLGDNQCIPEVDVREYESFQLRSTALKTLVSRSLNGIQLVGGVDGDKNFQQLDLCIVSAPGPCNPPFPTNCIYQNVEYRIKVNGPLQGYLRVVGGDVIIVPDFLGASGLNLYKEAGWGLRIAHLLPDGQRLVFETTGQGYPITLNVPVKDKAAQWFSLEKSQEVMSVLDDNQCVPEVSVKEYRPFLLKSSNLNTLVSKEAQCDLIVGGPKKSNKNFQQLELCVVSSDYGCSTEIKSNCIYQDIPYRIRVNSPVEGYLRITEQNTVEIVHSFAEASRLNLYKEKGWGLRIAHLKDDGTRIVFSATKESYPIVLEEAVTNAARQWFTLIEAN